MSVKLSSRINYSLELSFPEWRSRKSSTKNYFFRTKKIDREVEKSRIMNYFFWNKKIKEYRNKCFKPNQR
jgi:hypothetical protein